MNDFKIGDVVTCNHFTCCIVSLCPKRLGVHTECGDLHFVSRAVFFRHCTADETKEYWRQRLCFATESLEHATLAVALAKSKLDE